MTEINAKIESTTLGVEDHGIFTAWLHVTGDGWGQGFGGYGLDDPKADKQGREGTAYGAEWLRRVLMTLEVPSWEKLPGTPLRILREEGVIVAIGHFVLDKWFEPRTDLRHLVREPVA